MESGGTRAYEVAHRRWGKDDVCLHWAAVAAMQRVATYWHMLPEAAQARKAIWDAVNPRTGLRRIDEAFPNEICETKRDQEMFIRFKNGSTWQVIGSDNYDSLVGSPPAGVVFSEWALAKPDAWAYLKPILDENNGWALFISTPRGKNHAYRMYESHKDSTEWHCELQGVRESGTMTEAQIDNVRQEYIDDFGASIGSARFDQEYLCSWDAAVYGAVYADQLARVQNEGRICHLPIETDSPVNTFWDLGSGSGITSIWFHQRKGPENRMIDFEEFTSMTITDIVANLKEKGYLYGTHYLPHDGETKDRMMQSARNYLEAVNFKPVQIVPRVQHLDIGIEMTRQIFASCWFDDVRCKDGIAALHGYRYREDEKNETFGRPLHNWASHASDAFRQFAQGYRPHTGWNVPISERRKRHQSGSTAWRA